MNDTDHKFAVRVIDHEDKLDSVFRELTELRDNNTEDIEWIYRGLPDSGYLLQTSLERAFNKWFSGGLDPDRALHIEGGLIRSFKRQCYHYITNVPDSQNIMEWLALMRHHGAPTRLLDWSYSFFAGVYFAVETVDPERDCSVWALNQKWAWTRDKDLYKGLMEPIDNKGLDTDPNVMELETFRDVFMAKKPFVCPINAYRLNERLVIQQGTFLCPGDISKSFEENLTALAPIRDSKADFEDHLWEIRIKKDPPDLRKKILRKLHRMNMNRATLYPGLDGFAQSLDITLMGFPEILVPDREWERAMATHA
jgi:hypothetical protein